MPSPISRRCCSVGAVAAIAVFIAGCGSAHPAGRAAQVVNVTEKDFHIDAPSTLAAGEVVFHVHNAGPDEHEFIVMHGAAAALPLQNDGLTVDETAAKHRSAGELEPGAPGLTRTVRMKLAPGRYVFYCDMTGHFMGGMHTEVVVQ